VTHEVGTTSTPSPSPLAFSTTYDVSTAADIDVAFVVRAIETIILNRLLEG
jgi:hypothetical protein